MPRARDAAAHCLACVSSSSKHCINRLRQGRCRDLIPYSTNASGEPLPCNERGCSAKARCFSLPSKPVRFRETQRRVPRAVRDSFREDRSTSTPKKKLRRRPRRSPAATLDQLRAAKPAAAQKRPGGHFSITPASLRWAAPRPVAFRAPNSPQHGRPQRRHDRRGRGRREQRGRL